MGDRDRGFAWTRALHGLVANELHLCGDPSVLSVVQRIARDMKEEVDVRTYQRLTPLKMDADTIGSYENVEPGDCIVAFTRTEIYEIKQVSTPHIHLRQFDTVYCHDVREHPFENLNYQ